MLAIDQFRVPLVARSSTDEIDNFILYQPNPTKQILLYDMATSSSVLTYLKMKKCEFLIKNMTNTEFMSTNGRMPVVIERNIDKPLCGFTEVFWHLARKASSTPTLLELAYMDWVESKFLEAEMYLCWCYPPVVEEYTKPRYSYDLPWPVSRILFNRKRAEMADSVGKKFKNYDHFLASFNQFLTQLSKRIGNRPYLFSETSCVDALIYGHTKAILSTNLEPKFKDTVTRQRRFETLRNLIEERYPS